AGFSCLALALCLLGIYGVVAHSMLLRRREFAVRIAIGASRAQVLVGALRLGGQFIIPGLALGAAGSFLAGRALARQLFEVASADWRHFAASAALLGGIAFLACLLPAFKPTTLFRSEKLS